MHKINRQIARFQYVRPLYKQYIIYAECYLFYSLVWLYAHHLTSVDVSRCPEITPNALSDFASLMPGVNIRKTGI